MKRMMSREDDSFSVIGLKVLGSPNVATTSLPPRSPGSQSETAGGSGRGKLSLALATDDSLEFLPHPASTNPKLKTATPLFTTSRITIIIIWGLQNSFSR